MRSSWRLVAIVALVLAASGDACAARPKPLPARAAGQAKSIPITTGAAAARETPGIAAPDAPLGSLLPGTGLLPSGTMAVTLSLTTALPADCRWSESPAMAYGQMANHFQQGQGTTAHSTIVAGWHDLHDRQIYVRCQDLSGQRDPDGDAGRAQTHLRVLGPWGQGYPRIVNLYGAYELALGPRFYARYDLYIPFWWRDAARQAAAIRAVNPNAKILVSLSATYGWPGLDRMATVWQASRPGEAGYACLFRHSDQSLVSDGPTGPFYYNLTDSYCRDALVEENIRGFLAVDPDTGGELAYDGIYWDGLTDTTAWFSESIDADLDGVVDDHDVLNQAYGAGLEDLIRQVRLRLPYAILIGNESPLDFAPWLNGRLYEWQLPAFQNGRRSPTWDAVVADYQRWTELGRKPTASFIFGGPEGYYMAKYPANVHMEMPDVMRVEAATDYRRVRYGLTTALMGDGLFFYDLRREEGLLRWYDEYGAVDVGTALPPTGYLGQPTGSPMLLDTRATTPSHVSQGEGAGKTWLAGFQLQRGKEGVWARAFEHGLAVVNTTLDTQKVALPGTFCKLAGQQAPLFQVRVDDDEAQVGVGWSRQQANYSQFGYTVHSAAAATAGTVTYTADLPAAGSYEVFAWVSPIATQTRAAQITVEHAGGESLVSLDEATGGIGWRSLGVFAFLAGKEGKVRLSATGGGVVMADAFKWVSAARYNDGTQVDQVTLQPQDGIVLLASCYKAQGSR